MDVKSLDRVKLLTNIGEVPLRESYSYSRENRVMAQFLSQKLGKNMIHKIRSRAPNK